MPKSDKTPAPGAGPKPVLIPAKRGFDPAQARGPKGPKGPKGGLAKPMPLPGKSRGR